MLKKPIKQKAIKMISILQCARQDKSVLRYSVTRNVFRIQLPIMKKNPTMISRGDLVLKDALRLLTQMYLIAAPNKKIKIAMRVHGKNESYLKITYYSIVYVWERR
jgi:hypothetical protein